MGGLEGAMIGVSNLSHKCYLESSSVLASREPKKLNQVWFRGFLSMATMNIYVSRLSEVKVKVKIQGHFGQ